MQTIPVDEPAALEQHQGILVVKGQHTAMCLSTVTCGNGCSRPLSSRPYIQMSLSQNESEVATMLNDGCYSKSWP